MGTPTYTALANITLGSSAASVTFSSISQAYRDLVLVQQAKVTSGTDSFRLSINSDNGANYNSVRMDGSTSGVSSTNTLNATGPTYMTSQDSLSSTNPDLTIIHFMDYSATDKHKTFLARIDQSSAVTQASAHRWASTSAITTIRLTSNGSFAAGSTFELFGIAA